MATDIPLPPPASAYSASNASGIMAHQDKGPGGDLPERKDPSQEIPGMPPNFGKDMLPHVLTFQGIISSVSRVYRPSDEAVKDSMDNAKFMRNDTAIMECLEQRTRSTALLDWHLEPEDENDKTQKWLAEELTRILKKTPRFMQFRECLLSALWYGKYAVKNVFQWKDVRGTQRVCIHDWKPVNGDKLVYRYSDGSSAYKGTETDPDELGLRVGAGFSAGPFTTHWTVEKMNRVLPTDYGLAYFLEPWEREMLAVHKHMIEDGEYEDPRNAGRIHGTGIRSRIYWTWFQKQESLAWLMEFLERSAFGMELWYYPYGNPEAESKVRTAAQERIGEGRNIIMIPRPMGEEGMAYGVEKIEANMAGAEVLKSILTEYFGHLIKRYILGQTLTTEADATGLGSNLASVHLDTYLQIIKYDATNLEETMTTDVIRPLQCYNFPQYKNLPIRFKIETESPDVEGKLQAWRQAYEMGVSLKEEEVIELVGASMPGEEDAVLKSPEHTQAAQQMDMQQQQQQFDQQQAAAQAGLDKQRMGMEQDQQAFDQYSQQEQAATAAENEVGELQQELMRMEAEREMQEAPQVEVPDQPVYDVDGTPKSEASERKKVVEGYSRAEGGGERPFDDSDGGVDSDEKPPTTAEIRQREVDQAAKKTRRKPSDAQIKSGNYKKGKVALHGLTISIETPAGATRSGTDGDGNNWSVKMPYHYGYLLRTMARDGDHVDVFIGGNLDSDLVCVVDQVTPSGRFDEHKVMLGFTSVEDARAGYLSCYEPGWNGLGAITPMTVDQFKAWLDGGNTMKRVAGQVSKYAKRKPAAGQQSFAFDESAHPRVSKGSGEGGQFTAGEGGGGGKKASLKITPVTPATPHKDIKFGPDGSIVEGAIGGFPITTESRGIIEKLTEKTRQGLEEAMSKPEVAEALRDSGITSFLVVKSNQSKKGAPKNWTAGSSRGAIMIHPRTVEYLNKSANPERKVAGMTRVLTHEAGHGLWRSVSDADKKEFSDAVASSPQLMERVGKIVSTKAVPEAFANTGPREVTEAFAEVFAMKYYAPDDYAKLSESVTKPIEDTISRQRAFRKVHKPEQYKKSPDSPESSTSTPSKESPGWKNVGGSPMHIGEDGTIDMGCPGVKGEDVDELDDNREEREQRQDVAQSHGIEGEEITAKQAEHIDEKPMGNVPTAENPGMVTINGRPLEVKHDSKMWFWRQPGMNEWIAASQGMGELIKQGGGNVQAPAAQQPTTVAQATQQPQQPPAEEQPSAPEFSINPRTRFGAAVLEVAQDHNVPPDDVADAARHVIEGKQRFVRDREVAKQSARQLTGISAREVSRIENAGYDYASAWKLGGATGGKMRFFDEYTEEVAREYPELGITNADDLWNILGEGVQRPPQPWDTDILREAAELAVANAGYDPAAAAADDFEFGAKAGFAKSGAVEKFRKWREDRVLYARKPAPGQGSFAFDESKHDRVGKGSSEGGQFGSGGGSGGESAAATMNRPAEAPQQPMAATGGADRINAIGDLIRSSGKRLPPMADVQGIIGEGVTQEEAEAIWVRAGIDDLVAKDAAYEKAERSKARGENKISAGSVVIIGRSLLHDADSKGRLKQAMADIGDAKAIEFTKEGSDRKYMVFAATQAGAEGKWQISTFNGDLPMGHQHHNSKEEAVGAAIGAFPGDGYWNEGDADYRVARKYQKVSDSLRILEQYARKPAPGQQSFGFDEEKHPRVGKGSSEGGQFGAGGGGGEVAEDEGQGQRPVEGEPQQQQQPQQPTADPEAAGIADWKANNVRSQSFKSWFGDWERDPAGSSKVVDPQTGEPQEQHEMSAVVNEEGKPVKVFHGTSQGGWHTFDKSRLGNAEELLFGPGFYFTEDKGIAGEYERIGSEHELDREVTDQDREKAEEWLYTEEHVKQANESEAMQGELSAAQQALQMGTSMFGQWLNNSYDNVASQLRSELQIKRTFKHDSETKEVYLNIRKPFDIDGGTPITEEAAASIASAAGMSPPHPNSAEWDYLYGAVEGGKQPFRASGAAIYQLLSKQFGKQKANEILAATGYDGITHIGGHIMGNRDHRVWIAFEPNQIKSSDNQGTFDPANPDIRYNAGDNDDDNNTPAGPLSAHVAEIKRMAAGQPHDESKHPRASSGEFSTKPLAGQRNLFDEKVAQGPRKPKTAAQAATQGRLFDDDAVSASSRPLAGQKSLFKRDGLAEQFAKAFHAAGWQSESAFDVYTERKIEHFLASGIGGQLDVEDKYGRQIRYSRSHGTVSVEHYKGPEPTE
ncbi:MAG: DUF935 family protein [Chloroflexi bacterium]|nr:DUF935 family protein [Chloroflexota bacterium]